ncbi:lipid droplet-associated protein [Amycolatopsis cynarae]|uniref:Lipid droplet-associated protein n=1 Tax=Amycolatopsis cynarae TaxID=2995223 RepID=A0ABY7B5K4_9PSEU|nr:lipid droplet-associated protein [Amycolatopsis sp. HUAS 11-8]WAL66699.1 lipid droplet-associated protein [Amycolatopsis sp. HUAS 11-8]
MKPLPLPLRVAAGLAVTAAEHARELPKNLLGLPVTVLSQVLQLSMRLQQQVTELAIKGDEVLSSLRPVEETPAWATFDEDITPPEGDARNGHHGPVGVKEPGEGLRDPWEQEEQALAEDHSEGEFDSGNAAAAAVGAAGPVGLTNYDELTLPQLRARLRRLNLEQLEELLSYERSHANRPSFTGMLTRRIGNVRRLAEGGGTDVTGR